MFSIFMDMWDALGTNKKIGSLIENSEDGVNGGDPKRGFRPPMEARGFKYLQPPLFSMGSPDFTAQIAEFKKEGVEILTGIATPPDFSTFWTQAAQQGLIKQLKAGTMAKALLFPPAVEALGERGHGLTTEVWWSSAHPFKSNPDRPVVAPVRRFLYRQDRAAMDPAPRLQARQYRGGDRCIEALR